jgi:hypothetical protein
VHGVGQVRPADAGVVDLPLQHLVGVVAHNAWNVVILAAAAAAAATAARCTAISQHTLAGIQQQMTRQDTADAWYAYR